MINYERLRQVREVRGLTQTELARLVGVNQSAIAAFEAGRKQPGSTAIGSHELTTGVPTCIFSTTERP